jgi:hypothetical protein
VNIHRRIALGAITAVAALLTAGTSAALASTTSVYFDAKDHVGRQLGTASTSSAGAPKLLTAAAGRRLLDEIERQRRQISRLHQRVFGSG